ncbi:MAG TPA: hypothetical protein VF259_05780, partial [Solirubrobacterales bacterium]
FLQSTLGAFYPYYAFYGGTTYALLGTVSWLSSPTVAVLVGYGLALAAAYLSWTWIARQVGVSGWRAQLPGCIAVTAPLAVSNLYGRGAILETIATAAIPLVAASALSLFREPRVRLRDASLLVIGVVVLTGTHTLTLVWALVFLLICAAILVAANWRQARERAGRGLVAGGLAFLGLCINAWVLAPLVLYRDRLVESEPDGILHTAFTEAGQLFSPLRNGVIEPYVKADVNAQLPVLALLWVLVCTAVFWRFIPTATRWVAAGLLAVLAAFLLLIMSPGLIEDLPEALTYIQFPYRLITYFDLALVGLVTIALAALQRAGAAARVPVALLGAIAALSFGLSIDQNADVRSWLESRDDALASPVQPPPTWYALLQYADGAEPIVDPTLEQPLLFPVTEARRRSYTVTYPPGPAGTARTNIVTGPYMVELSGARPVGRTPESEMVVALPASERPREVEVEAGREPAVVAAGWLSIVSLIAAALGAVAFVALRRPPG